METEIKESLILLLDGINRSDGPAVTREMGRLEEMLERGRAGLPAQLAHFIERRSYAKALVFLGGQAPAVGTCGARDKSPKDGQGSKSIR
jgi:hypothetical protein